MAQLLLLRGVERSRSGWALALTAAIRPSPKQSASPRTGCVLPRPSGFSLSYRRPSRAGVVADFDHALIERIAAWCVAHAKLERPWIFAVLASEAARVAVSVTELSAALEDALLSPPPTRRCCSVRWRRPQRRTRARNARTAKVRGRSSYRATHHAAMA